MCNRDVRGIIVFKGILSVIFFTFFLVSRTYAFDLVILDSQTEITEADTGKVEKIKGNSEDVTKFLPIKEVLAPNEISTHIPYNDPTGVLSFDLLVPEPGKMHLEVDNNNTIYPRFDTEDMIFTRRGESRYHLM